MGVGIPGVSETAGMKGVFEFVEETIEQSVNKKRISKPPNNKRQRCGIRIDYTRNNFGHKKPAAILQPVF
jgi:hypothetical protein